MPTYLLETTMSTFSQVFNWKPAYFVKWSYPRKYENFNVRKYVTEVTTFYYWCLFSLFLPTVVPFISSFPDVTNSNRLLQNCCSLFPSLNWNDPFEWLTCGGFLSDKWISNFAILIVYSYHLIIFFLFYSTPVHPYLS